MTPRKFLETLVTDDDRFAHLHEVSYIDWDLVAQWEDEAKTDEMHRIFRSRRISLCHEEEYRDCGDI